MALGFDAHVPFDSSQYTFDGATHGGGAVPSGLAITGSPSQSRAMTSPSSQTVTTSPSSSG